MTTALVIIDMQAEMQLRLEAGRDCTNPDAGDAIAKLAAAFRAAEQPVVHVRHRDENPQSPFHPDSPGYPPMACAMDAAGEAVFVKNTSSAFASTSLEAHLRSSGITRLAVCGAVTGYCVTSTVRAASDLGFEVAVIEDAILGFDLHDHGLSAQIVTQVSLALLEDFATRSDLATEINAL